MLESRLQKALDGLVARGIVGAAATIARPDGSLVSASAGLADRANGVSTGPAHLFKIGSVTKTFVATAVLQLVGEGKLGLDDTVEDVLPGKLKGGEGITRRERQRGRRDQRVHQNPATLVTPTALPSGGKSIA